MQPIDYECKLTPTEQDKLRALLVRPIDFHGRKISGLASGSIVLGDLADGAVIAGALSRDSQSFNTNIVFSATDNDTVAWTSGTLEFASGESFSISAGNTGNMSALTYIYFAFHISTTVLQTSTTFSDAVGDDRRLLCVATKITDATQKAFYVPAVGVLGVNENNIGANSISANLIQANTITAGKLNVSQLSAISADIGNITAGTITGNTIRNTSSANNRIQFDSTSFTVTDGSGSEFFQIKPGTIGVTVYVPSLEQHPNIGGALILTTRQNISDSDYLQLQATGTSGTTKLAAIRLNPGAAGVGNITFYTANAQRMFLDDTGLSLSSISVKVTSGQGIATSAGTGLACDNTNGFLGYHSTTEVLKVNTTATKIYIAGTYYTLSVIAGVVHAT